MILAESELKKAIAEGDLRFDPPVEPEQIGPASIDLRLSNEFLLIHDVLEKNRSAGVESAIDLENYSFDQFAKRFGTRKKISPGDYLEVARGRLVLGYTMELIRLSSRLFARVEGKSSLARLGLFVHITAPIVQPGFQNQLQLELLNMGPAPIRVRPGKPVCQLIVERVEGTGTYSGQFQRIRRSRSRKPDVG